MSRALFTVFLISISLGLRAQYAVTNIPEELREGAQMVVREYNYEFTVLSESKGKINIRQAFTVLSEEGNDEAFFYVYYDNDRKVTSLSAKVYNGLGVQFDKLKRSDFKDVKSGDGFSLYDDNRILYYRPSSTTYPYTVVYEYSLETEKLLFYPTWGPIDDEQVSLQSAQFKINMPKGMKFRYQALNMENPDPKISQEGNFDVYEWNASNIKPVTFEPYSKGYRDAFPIVYTAPNKFSYEGYSGNFETWNDYALWFNKIHEDREELDPEYRDKILQLVAGVDDDLEKTRIIYEYLQNNTRYVSIQLGIGGYQAFPANLTAENGYGDCKALTTYTKAMLEVAGVQSNYILVRAGRNSTPIQANFPSQQFNHVFLSVPMEKDTVWLECTSQTTPFGYIGTFTGNRDVLFISENGGSIVRTPKYTEAESLQSRTGTVTLDESGNAIANISTQYQGIQYENNGINRYIRRSSEDQKKWLYDKVDIKTFEIIDFSFKEFRNEIPSIEESLELSLRNFASISGKRLFLKPNLMNKYSYMPPEDENRKSEILVKSGWTDVDSIHYIIPEGYYVESQSIEKSIQSEFGSYEVKLVQNSPNELIYIRKMVKNAGTYPKEKYDEFRDFHKQVIRADKRRIVFAKKT